MAKQITFESPKVMWNKAKANRAAKRGATAPAGNSRKDRFNGMKFFVYVGTALACLYAGLQGWVYFPTFDTVTSVLVLFGALAVVGVFVWKANSKSRLATTSAALLGFFLGVYVTLNWDDFGDYTVGDSVRLGILSVLVILLGLWISRREQPPVSNSTTP